MQGVGGKLLWILTCALLEHVRAPGHSPNPGGHSGNTHVCNDDSCPQGNAASLYHDAHQCELYHCTPCPVGTANNAIPNTFACTQCLYQHYAPAGSVRCTSCPIITTVNADQSACDSCPAEQGRFRGPTCTSCDAGKFFNTDRCTDLSCVSGQVESGNECVQCEAGKYQGLDNLERICYQCPAGKAGASTGATITGCIGCPSGAKSELGSEHCISCQAGETSNPRHTTCEPCPVGTYSSTRSACTPCGVGRSSPEGSTTVDACTQCPGGETSTDTGSGCFKSECEPGHYTPLDIWSVSMGHDKYCIRCPYNTINDEEATAQVNECKPCDLGTHANTDKTACVLCAAADAVVVFPRIDNHDEKVQNYGWLSVGDTLSIRTPCLCAHGILNPTAKTCDICTTGQIDYSKNLRVTTGMSYSQWKRSGCDRLLPVGCDAAITPQDWRNEFTGEAGTAPVRLIMVDWDLLIPTDSPHGAEYHIAGYGFEDVVYYVVTERTKLPCSDGIIPLNQISNFCRDSFRIAGTGQVESWEPYTVGIHPSVMCESCAKGKYYYETNDNWACEDCDTGQYQDKIGQSVCESCELGFFTENTRSHNCTECAMCEAGQYRDGCGDDSHAFEGTCQSCEQTCPEGSIPTACINRAGVSAKGPICKRKEFLTRTPLCQGNNPGIGLGGFDFLTVFGRVENQVDFQCSQVCNSAVPDADGVYGTLDTMECDGPFACNRMACSMESSSSNGNLVDFRVARACPVQLSAGEKKNPLSHAESVDRKRRVDCQKCSECGSTAGYQTLNLPDFGRGCAKECSMIECANGQIFDWTDTSCKRCDELSNVSLCADVDFQHILAVQDISGYRGKIQLAGCQAKDTNSRTPITYGNCDCCRLKHEENACADELGAAYHAGCEKGCTLCMERQNVILTSELKYMSAGGKPLPVYCQIKGCPDARTGVKDMGVTCDTTCSDVQCTSEEVERECVLPHDKKCVPGHPLRKQGQAVLERRDAAGKLLRSYVPAHANMLEHPDSSKYHFSNFENYMINVEPDAHEDNLHQCVWNAVDVRDNDMNPGGISSTFFPPAAVYADGLEQYGSKFCHRWDRLAHISYPLLPLQNTVSFDSPFPRRVLLNASARVMDYRYSGVGHGEIADTRRLAKASFNNIWTGDLYLSIDLTNAPNATLAVFVPNDRGLGLATWIPALRFSCVATENTRRMQDYNPLPLMVGMSSYHHTARSLFSLEVVSEFPSTSATYNVTTLLCFEQWRGFEVQEDHVFVSTSMPSDINTNLTADYIEMRFASKEVSDTMYSRVITREIFQGFHVDNLIAMASSTHTDACHVYTAAGSKIECWNMLTLSVSEVDLTATQIYEDPEIIDIAVLGKFLITLISLGQSEGQQLIIARQSDWRDIAFAESCVMEVDCEFNDMVALATNELAGHDVVWVLRKKYFQNKITFRLVHTTLDLVGSAPPATVNNAAPDNTHRQIPDHARLNTALVRDDLLKDVFSEDSEIFVSTHDSHLMTVSDSGLIFAMFFLVKAQHYVAQMLQTSSGEIQIKCNTTAAYPGLDASFTSVAWLSDDEVLLQYQQTLFKARCVTILNSKSVLEILPHPTSGMPSNPFVQYGASYFSFGPYFEDTHAVVLYSNTNSREIVPQEQTQGRCVFAPRALFYNRYNSMGPYVIPVEVTTHVNGYLVDTQTVIMPTFDVELLLDYADTDSTGQRRMVQYISSFRLVTDAATHVRVTLLPTPKLTGTDLFEFMSRPLVYAVSNSSLFWNSEVHHLLEARVQMPCNSSCQVASSVASNPAHEGCVQTSLLAQITLVESFNAERTNSSCVISSVFIIVRDQHGNTTALKSAGLHDACILLKEGAYVTQIQEVLAFSAAYIEHDVETSVSTLAGDGVDEAPPWRRLRTIISASSLTEQQVLYIQTRRTDAVRSIQRSVAIDAVQLLLVLTVGSAMPLSTNRTFTSADPTDVSPSTSAAYTSVDRAAVSISASETTTNTGWLLGLTCATFHEDLTATFKQSVTAAVCVHMNSHTTDDGVVTPCVARTFFSEGDEGLGVCVCHPVCSKLVQVAIGSSRRLLNVASGAYPDLQMCFGQTGEGCPDDLVSSNPHGIVQDTETQCVCAPGLTGVPGACVACVPGLYKNKPGSDACSPCPVNTYSRGSASRCEACPGSSASGEASTDTADCICNPGHTGSQCVSCGPNTFKNTLGGEACEECGAGTYAISAFTVCLNCWTHSSAKLAGSCECNKGYTLGEDDVSCVGCDTAYYKDEKGNEPCTLCPFNRTTGDGDWMTGLMLDGTIDPNGLGSTSESDCGCLAGQFLKTQEYEYDEYASVTFCAYCRPGKRKDTRGDKVCDDCPAGEYQSYIGQQICMKCATNTVSAAQGASECTACVYPEHTTGPGGSVCVLCAAGKYSDADTPETCLDCHRGKFGASEGQVACEDCAIGYHQSWEGLTVCAACVPGTYTDSTGNVNCDICVIGSYQDASAKTKCETCAVGHVSSNEYRACSPCGAGSFLGSNLECDVCPQDQQSGPAATVCTSCPSDSSASTIVSYLQRELCQCDIGYEPSSRLNPPEASRTYSSRYNNDAIGTGHARSMLDSAQAWSSSSNSAGSWMQIDLGRIRQVSGVVIQKRHVSSQCVSEIILKHSTDGSTFTTISTISNILYDGEDTSEHVFGAEITTRYIRFVVQTWHDHISMRAGVLIPQPTADPLDNCNICGTGTVKNTRGNTLCVGCAAGKYANTMSGSQTCDTCPERTYSLSSQTGIDSCQCNKGYTSYDGTAGGRNCAGQDEPYCYECEYCPNDSYKDTTGDSQCLSCPANSRTRHHLAHYTTSLDCRCKKGYEPNSEHTIWELSHDPDDRTCVPCPYGRVNKDSRGDNNPQLCELCGIVFFGLKDRRYSPDGEECHVCYAHSRASSWYGREVHCFCNGGYEMRFDAATTQHSAMQASPTVMIVQTNQYCMGCEIGFYNYVDPNLYAEDMDVQDASSWNPVRSTSECVACPPHSTSVWAAHVCECKPGASGQANAVNCALCAQGTESKTAVGAGNCALCPTGKSSGLESIRCEACGAGTHRNATMQFCTECPRNTYSSANAQDCEPCPTNSLTSFANSTSIDDCYCTLGHYKPPHDWVCDQCEPGKYKSSQGFKDTDGFSRLGCVNCPADTHSNAYGATSIDTCTACPTDSISPPGSPTVASCVCDVTLKVYQDRVFSDSGSNVCLQGESAYIVCRGGCPCTQNQISANSGEIDMPGYANNMNCEWTFETIYGIEFTFESYAGQNSDFVEHYYDFLYLLHCHIDGAGYEVCLRVYGDHQTGDINHGYRVWQPPFTFLDNTGKLKLQFRSDGSGLRPGFKISWQARPIPCRSGSYFIHEDEPCALCRAGKYSSMSNYTSATTCTECLPGYYAPEDGMPQCLLCDPGKYTILSNTQLRVTCHVSPAGHYLIQEKNTSYVKYARSCWQRGFYNSLTDQDVQSCQDDCSAQPVCVFAVFWLPCGTYTSTCTGFPLNMPGYCQTFVSKTFASGIDMPTIGAECDTSKNINTDVYEKTVIGVCQDKISDPSLSIPTPCSAGSECTEQCLVECPPGTWSAEGDVECTDCQPGKYRWRHGGINESSCLSCPSGKVSYGGSQRCSFCDEVYKGVLDYAEALSQGCGSCAPGFENRFSHHHVDATCQLVQFETNEERDSGCAASYACGACRSNTYRDVSMEQNNELGCAPCEAGKISVENNLDGSTQCRICQIGEFADTVYNSDTSLNEGTCTSCPVHTWSYVQGSAVCPFCAAGKVRQTIYDGECSDCSAGTYTDHTVSVYICTTCAVGTYSAAGQSPCVQCENGKIRKTLDLIPCQDCELGKFWDDSPTTCGLCGTGKYGISGGNSMDSSCEDCPVGSTTRFSGTTQVSDCVCTHGYYLGSQQCIACVAGKYREYEGWDSNTAVYSDGADHSSVLTVGNDYQCTDCYIGSYSNVGAATSHTTCTPCPTGSSSPSGSTTSTDCGCYADYYADEGSCTECPYGQWLQFASYSPIGSLSIAECLCGSGFYSVIFTQGGTNECTACPSNSISAIGSRTIADCECVAGFFGDAVFTQGSTCNSCPVNSIAPSGSLTIADCACVADFYSGGVFTQGGNNVCNSCPANSIAPSGSLTIADCECAAGFFGDAVFTQGSTCNSCPANSIAPSGSTNIQECLCVEDFYSGGVFTQGGNNVCTQCPSGQSSPSGSETQTDCGCSAGSYGDGSSCTLCPLLSTSPIASQNIQDCVCLVGFYSPPFTIGGVNTCNEMEAVTFECASTNTANCPCPVTGEMLAYSGTITIGSADTYYAHSMNCAYHLDTPSLLNMSFTSFAATDDAATSKDTHFVEKNYDFLRLYKVTDFVDAVQPNKYGGHSSAVYGVHSVNTGEGYIYWTPESSGQQDCWQDGRTCSVGASSPVNVFKDSAGTPRTGKWKIRFTSDGSQQRRGFELLWWIGERPTSRRRLLQAPAEAETDSEVGTELAGADALYVPMYLPRRVELEAVHLESVLYPDETTPDSWERLYVSVGLESRREGLAGCGYRIRVAAMDEELRVVSHQKTVAESRLHELGCTVVLDAQGIGECELEVPTDLATVNTRRYVALTAEVVAPAEAVRCQWPATDLFTATLEPHSMMYACAPDSFWSEDQKRCVACAVQNVDEHASVCADGFYMPGCRALVVAHLVTSALCRACNAGTRLAASFEWVGAGICEWHCKDGYFQDSSTTCGVCTTRLQGKCETGQKWEPCSHTTAETCQPCPKTLRGAYTENEQFVAATHAESTECRTECKPGHYRESDHSCRVCVTVDTLRLEKDVSLGPSRQVFFRFAACNESSNTLAVECPAVAHGYYTQDGAGPGANCTLECENRFHQIDGQCVECERILGLDGTPLPPEAYRITSETCDYECRPDHHYAARGPNRTCVLCNLSTCAVGSYLTGDNCSECVSCVHEQLANGLFASTGQLDDDASCVEVCPPNMFAGIGRCVPHTSIQCASGEYLLPGTPHMDSMCLPCSSCAGRRLVTSCQPNADSVCTACAPLLANEYLTDNNCTTACMPGTLRDQAGGCEVCATLCPPGTHRPTGTRRGEDTPTNTSGCAHCAPCASIPAQATFVDGCVWTCSEGFVLSGSQLCVAELASLPPRAQRRAATVVCSHSEYLDSAYQCRSCTSLGWATPDPQGQGVRWRRKVWGQGKEVCQFECLTPYIQYLRSADGTAFCYTSDEYEAHVALANHRLPGVLVQGFASDNDATTIDAKALEMSDTMKVFLIVMSAGFVLVMIAATLLL